MGTITDPTQDLTTSGSPTFANTDITTDLAVGGTGIIGSTTVTPDGTFAVFTASAGSVTADTSADDLVVENSAAGGITILTPDVQNGRLVFGSASDNFNALVQANRSGANFDVAASNVGMSLVLKGDNQVTNVTLSGAAAAELATAAGSVSVTDFFRLPSSGILTIATAVVTATGSYHVIAAETGTTDTLSTINGGTAGDFLHLTADAGDTITVDGAGNIDISTAGDFAMGANDSISLRYDGSNWIELSRSTN